MYQLNKTNVVGNVIIRIATTLLIQSTYASYLLFVVSIWCIPCMISHSVIKCTAFRALPPGTLFLEEKLA